MKSVRIIAPVLVAVCLVVPLAWSQGGSNVEQQVTALNDEVAQAYLKGDTSVLEKHFADDVTIIHSDGKLITKAEEIENFKSGALKFDSIDVRGRKLRVYGDAAVASLLASIKGTANGKPFSGDIRNTRVWVKQEGNWKVVSFQITRVAPASQ
jgi:uncharacterized protein (TIGR02246 family)